MSVGDRHGQARTDMDAMNRISNSTNDCLET
jgi:hypothetical protein